MNQTPLASARPISLSVFFPAYNEAANIADAINRIVSTADRIPEIAERGNYEVIVINDGSVDHTGDIAAAFAADHPERHIRIINHDGNRGYGAALQSGIRAAVHEFIFYTDADLQFDVRELRTLLAYAEEYDAVIGYRAPRRDPFMRLLNAWGWNRLNRLLFGLKVRDIDCAFKLYRRELVQQLPITSKGAMVSAEMLIRLSRTGARIKEVPVSHLPRTRGEATGAKPGVILRAFREMVHLYQGDLGTVTHKEALKFMTVGVINTLVDLAGYVVLTRMIPFFATAFVEAKFLSFLLGTVSSFVLNRSWTFGVRGRVRASELGRFYATVVAALAINTGSMYVFTNVFGVYDLLAVILVTGITFLFNFTVSKLWVFRKGHPTGTTPVINT